MEEGNYLEDLGFLFLFFKKKTTGANQNFPRRNRHTGRESVAKDDKRQCFVQLDLISCYYRKKVQTTKLSS